MSFSLSSLSAYQAVRQLGLVQDGLNITITRLTTGLRINRPTDDPAGLAISATLGAQVAIGHQGQRNANDGISYLQVAAGAMGQMTNLVTRMAELAQEAQTGTLSDSDRAALDSEFQTLLSSAQSMAIHTTFNGQGVFGNTLSVAAASFPAVTVAVPALVTPDLALGYSQVLPSLTAPGPATVQVDQPYLTHVQVSSGPSAPVPVTAIDSSSNGYDGQIQIGVTDPAQPFQINYSVVPTQSVAGEALARAPAGGAKLALGQSQVSRLAFQDASGNAVALTAGTDYSLDAANGVLTVLNPAAFANGLSVSYDYVPTQAVAGQSLTPAAGALSLQHAWVSNVVVKNGASLLSPGTDYTLDARDGSITLTNPGAYPNPRTHPLTVSYSYIPTTSSGFQTSGSLQAGQVLTLSGDFTSAAPVLTQTAGTHRTLVQGTDYTFDGNAGTVTLTASGAAAAAQGPLQVSYASIPQAQVTNENLTQTGLVAGDVVQLANPMVTRATALERPPIVLVQGQDYTLQDPVPGVSTATIQLTSPAIYPQPLTVSYNGVQTLGLALGADNLLTAGGAAAVAPKLAAALASLSTGQATVGATEQELQAVASALGTQAAGTTAAQDGIQDSNTADDVLSLTRFQILNQAGTKALGSADQASMQLLQLLQ